MNVDLVNFFVLLLKNHRAIKDIVDLCIKLRDEVGERKAAEAVGKI
jgi:hypothetical protein